MNTVKNYLLTLVLIVIIVVPNFRAIYKYLPLFQNFAIILYCMVFVGFIYSLKLETVAKNMNKWIGNYWYISAILILATVVIFFLYPMADGLKLQMKGSDQDDCVIIGASRLLNFMHPYAETSYFGNPCSPGLGMILLYLPFVFFGLYPFGAIAISIFTLYIINQFTKDVYVTAIFATILFGSLFWLEMLSVGSDLIFIGCGIAILSFSTIRIVADKKILGLICIGIFAGLIASTRVNFLIVAPLMSFFIFLHWKQGGIIFALLSIVVAIVPSAIVYFISPAEFTPLHLVGKSSLLLQGGLKEIGVLGSLIGFIMGSYIVRKSINNVLLAILSSLAPGLVSLSLGSLIYSAAGNFASWEGANYLMPILPLSVALLTIHILSSPHQVKNSLVQI